MYTVKTLNNLSIIVLVIMDLVVWINYQNILLSTEVQICSVTMTTVTAVTMATMKICNWCGATTSIANHITFARVLRCLLLCIQSLDILEVDINNHNIHMGLTSINITICCCDNGNRMYSMVSWWNLQVFKSPGSSFNVRNNI